jgi:hypothetical protein
MLTPSIPCGYAGGIGPSCIAEILTAVQATLSSCPADKSVWVDMESSLRTIIVEKSAEGELRRDVFSIDKCMACILASAPFGLV